MPNLFTLDTVKNIVYSSYMSSFTTLWLPNFINKSDSSITFR
jgi:hypothetical protein